LYKRFQDYLLFAETQAEQERFLFLEGQPLAFVMSDWKIGSIFVDWISLVALACLVFIAEYSREKAGIALYSVTCRLKVCGTQLISNFRKLAWLDYKK